MNEQWKHVPGYEEKYKISSFGRVKSLPRKKGAPKKEIILKTHNKVNGAGCANACFGDGSTHAVHRMVAKAFVHDILMNEKQVNHKDGNKLNNHYKNLEWVYPKENIRHAINTGLLKQQRDKYGRFIPP